MNDVNWFVEGEHGVDHVALNTLVFIITVVRRTMQIIKFVAVPLFQWHIPLRGVRVFLRMGEGAVVAVRQTVIVVSGVAVEG